jgi:hypothetical protein
LASYRNSVACSRARPVAHRKVDLRCEEVVVPRDALEGAPRNFLRPSPAIHVGRVEEVDAELERAVDARDGALVLDRPPVGEPGAERDL